MGGIVKKACDVYTEEHEAAYSFHYSSIYRDVFSSMQLTVVHHHLFHLVDVESEAVITAHPDSALISSLYAFLTSCFLDIIKIMLDLYLYAGSTGGG